MAYVKGWYALSAKVITPLRLSGSKISSPPEANIFAQIISTDSALLSMHAEQ